MGYWAQTRDGGSFAETSELVWGDAPADIMSQALEDIIKVFIRDKNRIPTEDEIKAGLLFSLHVALANVEFDAHLDGCGCHGDKSACGCGA